MSLKYGNREVHTSFHLENLSFDNSNLLTQILKYKKMYLRQLEMYIYLACDPFWLLKLFSILDVGTYYYYWFFFYLKFGDRIQLDEITNVPISVSIFLIKYVLFFWSVKIKIHLIWTWYPLRYNIQCTCHCVWTIDFYSYNLTICKNRLLSKEN